MDDRNLDQVLHDALALDRLSQIVLADKLVSNLAEDTSHDSAWRAEIRNRLDALDTGAAKLRDAREVIVRAKDRLRKR
jgi:hypothetical protein